MTALSINLNKIALIRNSREGNYPSIIDFANTCIDCGVDGITVHPRPDQRHIRPNDVRQLAELVAPLDEVEFNIEGNPFAEAYGEYPGLIALVKETLPEQCTLVPHSYPIAMHNSPRIMVLILKLRVSNLFLLSIRLNL